MRLVTRSAASAAAQPTRTAALLPGQESSDHAGKEPGVTIGKKCRAAENCIWPGTPQEALIAILKEHEAGMKTACAFGVRRASRLPPGRTSRSSLLGLAKRAASHDMPRATTDLRLREAPCTSHKPCASRLPDLQRRYHELPRAQRTRTFSASYLAAAGLVRRHKMQSDKDGNRRLRAKPARIR
jgi:hypothetical protein